MSYSYTSLHAKQQIVIKHQLLVYLSHFLAIFSHMGIKHFFGDNRPWLYSKFYRLQGFLYMIKAIDSHFLQAATFGPLQLRILHGVPDDHSFRGRGHTKRDTRYRLSSTGN